MKRSRKLFPGDRRGWATLALWLLLAVLLAAFVALAQDVYEHEGFAFDAPLLSWLHALARPGVTSVARTLSAIGEPPVVGAAAALVVAALAAARRWRRALAFALEVGGAAALTLVGKAFFARPRPALYPHLVPETNYSFPSGHAMGDLAFFLALHILAWHSLRGRWRWIGVAGVLVALAIGASRPYLQVHYPSDILAGWSFGAAWVLGVHLLVGRARTRPG